MSKTQTVLIAVIAICMTLGASTTLADAAKPETTEDFFFEFSFDEDWCSADGEINTVDKTVRGITTIFGGDNYKIEIAETYEVFNSSDELIGEGSADIKTQGKLTEGNVEIKMTKIEISCLNGEDNPIKDHGGYTMNKNGKVSHGN